MNRKPLLAVLTAFCLFVSCKKNNNSGSSDNTSSNGKAKLYIVDYHASPPPNVDTFHLSYDNDGRLTGAISSTYTYIYSYPTATSVEWEFSLSGQPAVHEIDYFTNGVIDSSVQIEGLSETLAGKYEYSGNLLSKETLFITYGDTRSISLLVSYTYDANGNAIETVQTDGQNSYQYINEYTYTDKPAPLPVVFPTNVRVPAKNLPATQVITIAGSPKRTITFSYAFDAAGRLTKETDTEDDGAITVKTYTY